MRFICLLSAILIVSASAFVPQNAARSAGVAMMAKKEDVVNFKKPEFVASVSEKTGLSKAESEAALAAVLETIQEVSGSFLFLLLGSEVLYRVVIHLLSPMQKVIEVFTRDVLFAQLGQIQKFPTLCLLSSASLQRPHQQ